MIISPPRVKIFRFQEDDLQIAYWRRFSLSTLSKSLFQLEWNKVVRIIRIVLLWQCGKFVINFGPPFHNCKSNLTVKVNVSLFNCMKSSAHLQSFQNLVKNKISLKVLQWSEPKLVPIITFNLNMSLIATQPGQLLRIGPNSHNDLKYIWHP